jgi:hypothetical protein
VVAFGCHATPFLFAFSPIVSRVRLTSVARVRKPETQEVGGEIESSLGRLCFSPSINESLLAINNSLQIVAVSGGGPWAVLVLHPGCQPSNGRSSIATPWTLPFEHHKTSCRLCCRACWDYFHFTSFHDITPVWCPQRRAPPQLPRRNEADECIGMLEPRDQYIQ